MSQCSGPVRQYMRMPVNSLVSNNVSRAVRLSATESRIRGTSPPTLAALTAIHAPVTSSNSRFTLATIRAARTRSVRNGPGAPCRVATLPARHPTRNASKAVTSQRCPMESCATSLRSRPSRPKNTGTRSKTCGKATAIAVSPKLSPQQIRTRMEGARITALQGGLPDNGVIDCAIFPT